MRRLDMKQNRLFILMAMLCLLSLMLDSWQSAAQRVGQPTWLDGTVCAAASPLQGLLTEGTRAMERGAARLVQRRRLADENVALRGRVADLEARFVARRESQGKSDRERELRVATAGMNPRGPIANVIGWGDNGWTSCLVLDCGESAGARVKDVAVAKGGVVGQVYAVSSTAARVLPITDPASGVAALVQRSRETGVLGGTGDGRCELRYLDPDADVAPGDTVLTSGAGGIFPKGLLVGTVTAVKQDRRAPGKVAEVRPAAALRKVEEVVLVRGGK